MTDNLIIEKMNDVFSKVLEKEMILGMDMTAEDIDGWDSLAHMQLVLQAEVVFNIEFDIDVVANIESVTDFVLSIKDKLEA